jgi:hypothetical protein
MATNNPNDTAPAQRPKGHAARGFASMDPAKQRAIASTGGRAAHASGNAHQFTSDEARKAAVRSHERRTQRDNPASGS